VFVIARAKDYCSLYGVEGGGDFLINKIFVVFIKNEIFISSYKLDCSAASSLISSEESNLVFFFALAIPIL